MLKIKIITNNKSLNYVDSLKVEKIFISQTQISEFCNAVMKTFTKD